MDWVTKTMTRVSTEIISPMSERSFLFFLLLNNAIIARIKASTPKIKAMLLTIGIQERISPNPPSAIETIAITLRSVFIKSPSLNFFFFIIPKVSIEINLKTKNKIKNDFSLLKSKKEVNKWVWNTLEINFVLYVWKKTHAK